MVKLVEGMEWIVPSVLGFVLETYEVGCIVQLALPPNTETSVLPRTHRHVMHAIFGAACLILEVENAVGSDMDRKSPPKPYTGTAAACQLERSN